MTNKPQKSDPQLPNRREFLTAAAIAPLAVAVDPIQEGWAVQTHKSPGTPTVATLLRKHALEGLSELELSEPALATASTRARLEKELSLIEQLGLSSDLLTAYDLVHHYGEPGFLALGREVEHCSLVAYVLGIVRVSPISQGLSYEEFAYVISLKRRISLDVCSLRWDALVAGKPKSLHALRVIPDVSLAVIHRTQTLIRETRDRSFFGLQAPLDDSATYQMLSLGETEEIPFLNQPQSRHILTRHRPDSFEDLVSFAALDYGWFDSLAVWEFIAAKRGRVRFVWPSPIGETLSSTYGQAIFRDQAFRVIQDLLDCDYTAAAQHCQEMIDPTNDNYVDSRQALRKAAREIGLDDLMTAILLEQFGRVNIDSCSRAIRVYGAFHDYTLAYLKTHFPREYSDAWEQVKEATGITF